MKKLFSFLFALFVAIGANATTYHDFEVGGIYYKIIGSTNNVSVHYRDLNGSGYKGYIKIPQTVTYNDTKYTVTSISIGTFANTPITGIQIPKTIKSIYQNAFLNCTSLKTVHIQSPYISDPGNNGFTAYARGSNLSAIFGDQVEYYMFSSNVGDYALLGASKLKKVAFLTDVEKIGYKAFGCENLKTVIISSKYLSCPEEMGLEPYTQRTSLLHNDLGDQVEEYIFNVNPGKYVLYGADWAKTIKVNDGCTSVGDHAFSGMRIATLTIGKNCKSIGSGALGYNINHLILNSQYYCNEKHSVPFTNTFIYLDKLSFGSNVTSISNDALYGEPYTKSGTVDFSGINSISGKVAVFIDYDTIIIDKKMEDLREAKIYFLEIQFPANINTFVFKDTVNSNAFYNGFYSNTSFALVQNIVVKGAKQIPDGMFHYVDWEDIRSYTKTIELPDDLTVLGNSCFENLTSLVGINFPSHLTTLGSKAFYNCEALPIPLVLPNTVESIGAQCFEGCKNISVVNIPGSVKSIGADALKNCEGLYYLDVQSTAETEDSYCSGSGKKLKYLKDLTDKIDFIPEDKSCTVIVKTEKRAEEWREAGYTNVISLERIEKDVVDTNMDGKINAKDALKIYDAMMKQ